MAFTRRRQEDRSSPSLGYRISSDRQPGIEQANIRRGPTGRTLADSISTLPERSFNYFPPPGLDRIGNLPGAKPPDHIVDRITDVLGIGDRRKERYIAATQGGHPGRPRGFQGFDTSETARENYISRTGGGYPDRPRDSSTFMDRYEDYPFLLGDPNPRITPKGRRVGPRHWQVDKDMFKDMMIPDMKIGRGIGSLMPYEEAAVDPSDWRVLQQILNAGGNPDDYVQTAMGPDDDYPMFPSGPGIRGPRLKYEPEVRELDLFDMMDDDTFLPDFDQDEYYSSGIMGAMPEERQVAERLNIYPDYYYNYMPEKYGGNAPDVTQLPEGSLEGDFVEFPDLADWLQGQGIRRT